MAYPPPPYADAVCGVPLCGEAICGTWWAYPLRGRLNLSGRAVIVAGLAVQVSSGRGTLTLSGRQVGYAISTSNVVRRGTLTLSGRRVDFVGQIYLHPADCLDIELVQILCSTLALTGASTSTIELQPASCR